MEVLASCASLLWDRTRNAVFRSQPHGRTQQWIPIEVGGPPSQTPVQRTSSPALRRVPPGDRRFFDDEEEFLPLFFVTGPVPDRSVLIVYFEGQRAKPLRRAPKGP